MAFHSTYIKNKRSDCIIETADSLINHKFPKSKKGNNFPSLIAALLLVASTISGFAFSEEYSPLTVSPTGSYSIELLIEKNEPVNIEIDTKDLGQYVHGQVPVKFYSKDGVSLLDDGEVSDEILWHNKNRHVMEGKKRRKLNNNETIGLTLNTTEEMVGKKVRVILEKEENFSKVAAIGAFLPQLVPILATNDVVWFKHAFWTSFFRWNYLLLELDVIHSFKELVKNEVFTDNSALLAQCTADFVEGFTVYQLTNYGSDPFKTREIRHTNSAHSSERTTDTIEGYSVRHSSYEEIYTSREDAFRTYLAAVPPNRFMDCLSSVVADSLKSLQHKGRLQEIFGNWSVIATLNDEALEGISKLMLGYGFNLIADTPGVGINTIKSLLGVGDNNEKIGFHFNIGLKTSIQYTIHNGYLLFFKGRGWDATSAYGLSTGVGLMEIAYRAYQAKGLYGIDQHEMEHQITSIGDRAEAIASSGYQLIPLPDDIKQYAVPAVAASVLTGLAYYAINSTGFLSMDVTNGLSQALQKAARSSTNGLVLGLMAYIVLPYVKDLGMRGTQMLADRLVSWADAGKNDWVGYFLAGETQYQVRVEFVH